MKTLAALTAIAVVSACASVQATLDYPATMPDADVHVGGHQYALWFHPDEQRLLMRRGPPEQLGVALAEGWAIYGADETEPTQVWRAGADAVLAQMGCQSDDVSGSDQIREFTYTCRADIDPKREITIRRELWREGVRTADPRTGAMPRSGS